jgi:hypothetical protein
MQVLASSSRVAVAKQCCGKVTLFSVLKSCNAPVREDNSVMNATAALVQQLQATHSSTGTA